MFFLLGNDKQKNKQANANTEKVKELFKLGRFPVVTTQDIADRKIAKVLGLVCCRGFDADEAFFGMAAMAQNKGGQAIVGYSENIAFHPDGSKYFSCMGTAIVFERESRDVRDIYGNSHEIPSGAVYAQDDDTAELLNLAVSQAVSPEMDVQNIATATQQAAPMTPTASASVSNVAEDEDPVLQKLLAQKKDNKLLKTKTASAVQ